MTASAGESPLGSHGRVLDQSGLSPRETKNPLPAKPANSLPANGPAPVSVTFPAPHDPWATYSPQANAKARREKAAKELRQQDLTADHFKLDPSPSLLNPVTATAKKKLDPDFESSLLEIHFF